MNGLSDRGQLDVTTLTWIKDSGTVKTVKGGKRQGGQKKRWANNIREWTGLESAKSQRTVENREKWRKLVEKSSVVPRQPSQLRSR